MQTITGQSLCVWRAYLVMYGSLVQQISWNLNSDTAEPWLPMAVSLPHFVLGFLSVRRVRFYANDVDLQPLSKQYKNYYPSVSSTFFLLTVWDMSDTPSAQGFSTCKSTSSECLCVGNCLNWNIPGGDSVQNAAMWQWRTVAQACMISTQECQSGYSTQHLDIHPKLHGFFNSIHPEGHGLAHKWQQKTVFFLFTFSHGLGDRLVDNSMWQVARLRQWNWKSTR